METVDGMTVRLAKKVMDGDRLYINLATDGMFIRYTKLLTDGMPIHPAKKTTNGINYPSCCEGYG
jgi:hypothetical protein